MLKAVAIIFLCQLVGETIVAVAGLPFPGPVLGMVLLFVGLLMKGSVPDELGAVGGTLLQYLALLFVPAGVGIMSYLSQLEANAVPLLTALVIPTLLTTIASALVMRRLGSGSGRPAAGDAGDEGQ